MGIYFGPADDPLYRVSFSRLSSMARKPATSGKYSEAAIVKQVFLTITKLWIYEQDASACTIFTASSVNNVFAGNNEDMCTTQTEISVKAIFFCSVVLCDTLFALTHFAYKASSFLTFVNPAPGNCVLQHVF